MHPEALEQCLNRLGIAVALADVDDWTIAFENARFFQWFAPTGETEDLAGRLAGLDATRARSRLADGRPFAYEVEVRTGARTSTLSVTLRRERIGESEFVLVEAQDIGKQKQAEYMLDSYSQMAERNTRELEKEKERVEKLLLNIMPRSVYTELKDFGTTTPQRYEAASVLMLDFVGFTSMAIARDPSAVIAELNDIFSAFDRIAELFGCERLKTIGDAYMAVSGVPDANVDHASNIAKVALRMRRYLERRNASHPTEWLCRIGIDTGPLIGSIVGVQKYVYDVFGPAVNLASRLEHLSEPMQISLTEATYTLLRDEFVASDRGEFDIKGFGPTRLYALEREMRAAR